MLYLADGNSPSFYGARQQGTTFERAPRDGSARRGNDAAFSCMLEAAGMIVVSGSRRDCGSREIDCFTHMRVVMGEVQSSETDHICVSAGAVGAVLECRTENGGGVLAARDQWDSSHHLPLWVRLAKGQATARPCSIRFVPHLPRANWGDAGEDERHTMRRLASSRLVPLARRLVGLGWLTTPNDEADALSEFTSTLIESETAAIGRPAQSRQRRGSAARRPPWHTDEVCIIIKVNESFG